MKIIGFSGIDGSGKTTQISLVQNALLEIGESSIIYKHHFKQPSVNYVSMSKLDECLELALDYNCQFSRFIHSCNGRCNYILCDRSLLCYLVNGIVEFNLDETELIVLFNTVSKEVIPHCTVLLEIPIDIAFSRIQMRIEKPPETHETVAKLIQYKRAYDYISDLNLVPNIHTVNGFNTMTAITLQIINIITKYN